jgi:hypothetical protein
MVLAAKKRSSLFHTRVAVLNSTDQSYTGFYRFNIIESNKIGKFMTVKTDRYLSSFTAVNP